MARRCNLTKKAVLSGNRVSHSNRKTRRRFLPNLQNVSVLSDALGIVKIRISTRAIKAIENRNGIDSYLMSKANSKLPAEALALKKLIKQKYLEKNNLETK